MNLKVDNGVLITLEKIYSKLAIVRSSTHVYVNVDIEYYKDGSVEILMKQDLLEIIEEFYEEITSISPTSAASYFLTLTKTTHFLM